MASNSSATAASLEPPKPAPRKFGFFSTADQVLQGVDITGKVALVTGGNSGIGLETCRALAGAGASVVLCARRPALGEEAAQQIRKSVPGAKVQVLELDLADLRSVARAAAAFAAGGHPSLDMLICNAGVMACPLTRTALGIELQSGVNWIGHMHLVNLLLPLMKKQASPSRIVVVSSYAHVFGGLDLSDLNWTRRKYAPWLAYGQSKTAEVLLARQLAVMLKDTPIRTFSLHPGNIQTNLQRHAASMLYLFFLVGRWLPKPLKTKTIPEGAATQVWAATAPELEEHSGAYLNDCELATSSKQAADMALAGQLWEAGERLIAAALAGELAAPLPGAAPSTPS